jgi:tetratricopeptide (TPR) repeat protein
MVSVRLIHLLLYLGLAAQQADPQQLIREARKLNSEGRQEEAIAIYQQLLEPSPDLYDAHYGLGIAFDLAGRYDDAREQFARAIEIAPEDSKDQALTAMAISCAFSGDVKAASTFYRQLFDRQIAADNLGGASETANALGRVYLETGNLTDALKWYETGHETAKRQRDLPGPLVDLFELRWSHAQARIAARRGNAADARRHVAAVRAILDKNTNPDEESQYPYLVGYVELALKNAAAALPELQKANQEDPFVLFLLAQAYEQSGEAGRARETYERVTASNAHSLNNALVRNESRRKLAASK